MFSEEIDWDVPEYIKSLNKEVFHSNIKDENQAVKRTKNKQIGNECGFDKIVKTKKSKLQKSKEKEKTKQANPNFTSQLLETEVECLPSTCKLQKKKKKTLGSLEKEKSETKQPHKLLHKEGHEKQKTNQLSGVNLLNGSRLNNLKSLDNASGSTTAKNGNADSLTAKKAPKRKVTTLNDEPVIKKTKSVKTPDIGKVSSPKKRPMDVKRLKTYLTNAKHVEKAHVEEAHVEEAHSDDLHKRSRLQSSLSLGERMSSQLNAARFRYINEQLYSCTGKEAGEMFRNDKESFAVYHTGFRSQVDKWPVNPVDRMIEYIKHSDKSAIVADFGCGDAKIARSVPNVVHSFDLVALNSHVIACDMRHVALPSSSVDIAVFCLSLMGTNLVEYLCEANRVLKMGSVLLIAEVVSRFEKVGKFAKKLHKLGFSLVHKDADNKMFVWLEFTKTSALPSKDLLPDLELLPCLYKKR